jgi:acyl-CoA synthetase (AMP-forming)/AMP-acid ligase II
MIAGMGEHNRPENYPVPAGETGHILVGGKTLFDGYLDQQSKPVRGRWFDTGDIGCIDEDGYLTVLGRADNIIISGGENIDLGRIEYLISSIQGINGVVALGLPDKKWGMRPIAFIEMENDRYSEDELKTMLAEHLPRLMIPDRIIEVSSLPISASGKYDRPMLRIMYQDLLKSID